MKKVLKIVCTPLFFCMALIAVTQVNGMNSKRKARNDASGMAEGPAIIDDNDETAGIAREARRQRLLTREMARVQSVLDAEDAKAAKAAKPKPRTSKIYERLSRCCKRTQDTCNAHLPTRCSGAFEYLCGTCYESSVCLSDLCSDCYDIVGNICSPCFQLCRNVGSSLSNVSTKGLIATTLVCLTIFTMAMEKSNLFSAKQIHDWEHDVSRNIAFQTMDHVWAIAQGLWDGVRNPDNIKAAAKSVYDICMQRCPGNNEVIGFKNCHDICS